MDKRIRGTHETPGGNKVTFYNLNMSELGFVDIVEDRIMVEGIIKRLEMALEDVKKASAELKKKGVRHEVSRNNY